MLMIRTLGSTCPLRHYLGTLLSVVHTAADIWGARLEGGSLFPTRMAQFLLDGRGGCSDTPAG